MRLCVYNATHLASAMEINKFISAALGLVRFFISIFGVKGTPLTSTGRERGYMEAAWLRKFWLKNVNTLNLNSLGKMNT